MKTRMTELLGIEHPIMCGGMMWLARPGLCAAISNAGALGNLTAGNYESAEEFREAVRETRALTARPFCVNITLMPSVRITRELHEDYFRVCCEEKVTALEISGAPLDRYLGPDYIAEAKKAGVRLIHKVGAVRHALHAEKAGYDAVIAAGIEEGGHPLDDDVTTMVLTPRISESLSIPVITAGGIADGRGLAAALVLGADGVMMASRFIATEECQAHENIKRELIGRQEYDTTLICKTIELQMRCLKNAIAAQVLEIEACKGDFEDILPYIIGARSRESWETGDADMAPLAVGQSIGLIKDMKGCREVVEGMVAEAGEILSRVRSLTA
ncbi:MAG: nitronate monooxygenase [Actinomycetota bacterium]|nr:nitronate monooxygenase [Actinomycetota bacterium]MDD5668005.1 nitronate monooxygenase [Actinomycetota bacterium]